MAVAFALAPHFLLLLLTFSTSTTAQQPFRPKALVLPVSKDPSTLQYITQIHQRTPLVPLKLTLDLGGQFLWVDCETNFISSTFKPVRCGSAQCIRARSRACTIGETFKTCNLILGNPINRTATLGDFGQDTVSVTSTNGYNPGRTVLAHNFLFTCSPTYLLADLAKGVVGMAGLGWNIVSMPTLFSSTFSFNMKFAICLTSSTRASGVVFFGNEPYRMLPNMDVSKNLIYTPLIRNPVSTASAYWTGEKSSDYFIGVKSIKINGKVVPLDATLLKINKEGYGGTKISTVDPYTIMQTSIYKAVTGAFAKSLSQVRRVKPVAPFGVCFDASKIGSTRVGPGVPQIDLVLESEKVIWSIFGANSMVLVRSNVLCLGFVDGGLSPRTSIVIGGYQLEDNLLQFDLAASRLGFSSSLLFRQTTCANFNFTSSST